MMTAAEWVLFEAKKGPSPEDKPFHLRGPSSRSVRRAVARAQEFICPICGYELAPNDFWTIDHVVPKSMGGFDHVGNFTMVHAPCNTRKGNRPPTGCELIWLLAVNNRLGVPAYAVVSRLPAIGHAKLCD